jgi:hypothetical protein
MDERANMSQYEPAEGIPSLTANQQKALAALLNSTSLAEAAETAGLSTATLKRYLAEDRFANAFRDLRLQVLDLTVAGLQAACSDSLKVVLEIVRDEEEEKALRLKAANSVFAHMDKLFELSRRARETGELADLLYEFQQSRNTKHNGHQRGRY